MTRLIAYLATVIFTLSIGGHADEAERLEYALGEDHAGIEAIALYPEEIRLAILEASTHPELIVKVAGLQRNSSLEFEDLMSELDNEDQEALWDLTRFPGLIDALVVRGIKTKSEIREILFDYPEEIHETALKYGRSEYDVIFEIQNLNGATQEQFASVMELYPLKTRESYGKLVMHPEIMTLLEEDMSLTVLLGDAYGKDPQGVRELAAALNLKLASDHAEDLSQFGNEMSEPVPAAANGETQIYGDSGFASSASSTTEVSVTYFGAPYSYCFGYPGWYAAPTVYAGLNWYVTPRLRTSVSFYPSSYTPHRHAPGHHHAVTWSKSPSRRTVKVVSRSSKKPQRRR